MGKLIDGDDGLLDDDLERSSEDQPTRISHLALAVISPTHACNALSCSAFSWQVW